MLSPVRAATSPIVRCWSTPPRVDRGFDLERSPGHSVGRMKMITTLQRPIGSGFGPASTAADVLRAIDLSGKIAIVTGGYSGIGLETTRALAAAGAHVVVPARRPALAAAALPGVEVGELDLADLASVARFTDRFLVSGRGLDIAVLNAGVMASPETRVGPGWEAQFAVNHLGHFALINRLRPGLRP